MASGQNPSSSPLQSFGKEEEGRLEAVLTKAGLLHLKSRFVQEKVSVNIIPFLNSEDWVRLGVSAVGDRVVLVQLSKAQTKDEAVTSEMRCLFGPTTPTTHSGKTACEDSFATKAERLCGKILSGTLTQESSRRRKRAAAAPCPRAKEWTKNVVVIDYQGQREHEALPLFDYQKIFDGLIRISSDMSENDVRDEIVRLVHLKHIPTHQLQHLTPDAFSFVKVYNRKVRPLDGDVPCDGTGVARIYRNGSIYLRLKDTTLWMKQSKPTTSEPSPPVNSPVLATLTTPTTTTVTLATPSCVAASYTPNVLATSPSTFTPPSVVGTSQLDSYSTFINLISDSESDGDDVDLQRIIEESLQEESLKKNKVDHSLADVLEEHVTLNVEMEEDYSLRQRIPVRRRAIWKDTLRCLRMPSFVYNRGLNIRFVGEEAVDVGGPLREYLRLLMKELGSNCALVCGAECHRTAVHNTAALDKQEFLYVGQSIAISIVYGGPGPHFFSETAANYLLGLQITHVPYEDIPDPEVTERIRQIECSASTESLRNLLDTPEFLFRFDCGCPMPSSAVTIDDRHHIAKCLAMHFVVYSQKAELDQIKQGFDVLHFSALIKSSPHLLKPLFVAAGQPKLTASTFLDLFTVNWSIEGSNMRVKEEEVILHWNYYVSELEGGRGVPMEDGSGEVIHLDLGNLLSFVTGADHPPPLGFSAKPQIEFTDDPKRVLPRASTCFPTLYLSLHVTEYEAFHKVLDEAIISAHGFGSV